MVAECTLKRLGDLPFDFVSGTCGTFMINSLPTIFLCFYSGGGTRCRSLIRRNDGALHDTNNFVIDSEFEIDTIDVLDSIHDHYSATLANYQGFPVILGSSRGDSWGILGANNKLEILNTIENPPRWVEGTNYPYANE